MYSIYLPIVKFFNLHNSYNFNWRFLDNNVSSGIVETSNNVTLNFSG